MGDSARTVTELYQALRPLILRDVAAAAAPAAAGGGMAAHALSGPFHSGSLAEGQAPWAATKGELVAHAALPDVHHATATAGNSGISVSGQAISLAAAAAGAGLTFAAGVLAVGVANTGATGLSAEADAVRLTSSSNPGAAASILASTAAGGLTLQSLAVQGSVDVTNGGDLTVAGSGAYAGSSVLFVDSSGGNVGIMGAPDPQFALDVVGPCRATWFIGPHAIQLKDVLLLSHFDGRQPFETNFSGEPNGHMGQVATATNVIYRQGKFGTKAAQIANAKTNLITNPSFETGTSGWATIGGATTAQTLAHSVVGSYAMNVNRPSGTTAGTIFTVTSSTRATYYGSVWVRATSSADVGKNVSIFLRFTYTDASTSDTTRTDHTLTSGWVRISNSGTTNGAKTLSSVAVHVRDMTSGGTTHAWLMDAVQLETVALTPYVDGTLGSGHSWSGTAHASTSSRSAASLTYPTSGNVNEEVGTVMAWVNLPTVSGGYDVLRVEGSTAGRILLYVSAGKVGAYWGTAALTEAGTINAGQWHHVAMTYSGTTLTTYVDGVQVATGSSSGFSGMPTSMSVGTSNILNGWIDDLCITESAIDADGIRAIYESGAPVFAESSRFSFRATPQGLVWADDEGLWMRNSTGGTVLGAYGGAATKSWAGLTLDPSDVVIGDSARGAFLRWDDSAGTLQLGKTGSTTTSLYLSGTDLSFRVNATERVSLTGAGVLSIKDSGGAAVFTFDASAGAEFTKPLTIAVTTGGIYQGTGSFASPTNGMKIYNSGGIGQIASYDGGTKTFRIGDDDVRYLMTSDYDDIRTVKWLDNIDFSGTWSDLSSEAGQYAFVGGYKNSNYSYLYLSSRVNDTGTPSNPRGSSIQLVATVNHSGTVSSGGMDVTTLNSTYNYETVINTTSSYFQIQNISSTPSLGLTASTRVHLYVKDGKLVLRYNDAGTYRYKYLDLTGTGATWTHSTTAP